MFTQTKSSIIQVEKSFQSMKFEKLKQFFAYGPSLCSPLLLPGGVRLASQPFPDSYSTYLKQPLCLARMFFYSVKVSPKSKPSANPLPANTYARFVWQIHPLPPFHSCSICTKCNFQMSVNQTRLCYDLEQGVIVDLNLRREGSGEGH